MKQGLIASSGGPRKRVVGSTLYFLAAPNTHDVLRWFQSQKDTPEEHSKVGGALLYYRQFGNLVLDANGEIDVSQSPVVTVVEPQIRLKALWTVGEVHFLAKGTATDMPEYHRLRRRFQSWLGNHPIVWDRVNDGIEDYGYYLEGSVKNFADRVFALQSGAEAFEGGQYFVAYDDNEFVLDRICRLLRLRGVECG